MNSIQQLATGVMAVLMLGAIVMMPSHFHSRATYSASVLRQVGPIAMSSQVARELPQEQVRDLTYN